MKRLFIRLIRFYQKIPGNFHNACKYQPTCSEYAIVALERFGTIKGSYLAFKRILRCAPWGKGGFDPVPERK